MDFGKLGGLIEAVAPTIATALGGPLAGMATRAISSALFGHQDGSADDIQAALLGATPEQLSSLKKVDDDFKVQMKQLDINLEQIAEQDRDSARRMQTETRDWIPRVLAVLIVGGFATITGLKMAGWSTVNDPSVSELLTTLRDGVILVLSFFFGSSSGSQRKDEMIYKSTPIQ
jgi:hypothetical protein